MRRSAYGLDDLPPLPVMPWADRGLCLQRIRAKEAKPDDWYPVEQGADYPHVRRAIEVCMACPVRRECHEWAMEHYEHGIWGGTTALMRKAARRREQRAAAKAKAAS